jgi:rare lipoprotein A
MNHILAKTYFLILLALTGLVLLVPFAAQAEATAIPQLPRDPYLAAAINSLPEYNYTQAGSVTSPATPITILGQRTRIVIARPVTLAVARPATVVASQPAAPAPRPAPVNGQPLVMEGEASYYSWAGCLGCNPLRIMANGQPLNDNALTMAIGADKKHLVGHQARVTNLVTGQSVMVKITDTGGFYQAKYGHRVADLTIASKQAIGMNGGVGQVRVEVY